MKVILLILFVQGFVMTALAQDDDEYYDINDPNMLLYQKLEDLLEEKIPFELMTQLLGNKDIQDILKKIPDNSKRPKRKTKAKQAKKKTTKQDFDLFFQ